MGVHRTSRSNSSLTTGSIAALVKGELIGPTDLPISGIDALDEAGPGAITFIRSSAFASRWATSGAAAALVTRGIEVPGHDRTRRALIIVPDADAALGPILSLLAPQASTPAPGVHPSSVVDPGATVDPEAAVGPLCIIGEGAVVGAGAVLIGAVTLGAGASVGARSVIHPGVVIGERCSIGAHCILHAGVVIGADGFGYAPDAAVGGRGVVKIPHIGNVQVGNDVEIGANSCIDRAKFGSTTIGDGTKIDNLVQIAHNCRVGKSCLICGGCGLAGSVTLGDGVIIAGHVGIADNLTIGAGARIGARSGVGEDVPPGQTWLGVPAQPVRDAARNLTVYRNLANHIRELRRALKAETPGP